MPNIWKLKQEICEIGRRMYERGLVAAFEGNISAKMAPDRVLCTPSLQCKGLLRPEDLCVVDMSGKQLSGDRKRSSEIFLHLAVYRARSDVEAVVHTHPPHVVAFAVTHTPLPQCITAEVEVFLGEVPLVPYATPGTPELGESIVPFLRDTNAAILCNHGAVSWGRSPEEALQRTEILEAYCRTLHLARQLGPIQRLSNQNMRDLMAIKQKLGLPDHRVGQERFDEGSFCGNNEFGRGFTGSGEATGVASDPSRPALTQGGSHELPASAVDVDRMVREIADRVLAELGR